MPTTASFAAVACGVTIKTLLQLKPFNAGKIIAWGITFDGVTAANVPVECELLETGTIFATVTASLDADVFKVGGGDGAVASIAGLTLGTAATGYTASAEGAIVATKLFDAAFVSPTSGYVFQFPLGQEPQLLIASAYRVRVKAANAVNAITWVEVEI